MDKKIKNPRQREGELGRGCCWGMGGGGVVVEALVVVEVGFWWWGRDKDGGLDLAIVTDVGSGIPTSTGEQI
jgi:hypothetical protein